MGANLESETEFYGANGPKSTEDTTRKGSVQRGGQNYP